MVLRCLKMICGCNVDFSQQLLLRQGAEMLGQLQTLALIVGTQAFAVTLRRRISQPLEHQPADDLAMLKDERHLPRPHLQHAPRRRRFARLITETRIEGGPPPANLSEMAN